MDRESLFQGKRLDNRGWVQGSLISFGDGGKAILPSKSDVFQRKGDKFLATMDCYEVDPSTVGQYTGLTDKNGVKIFEGDILERRLLPTKRICTRSVVKFAPAHAAFAINDMDGGSIVEDYLDSITRMNYEIEVVGNIHDNPELMGGEADG